MKKGIKRTQISFDIHPDLHAQIKIAAAIRNISMNLWLTRAIHEALKKEKQPIIIVNQNGN